MKKKKIAVPFKKKQKNRVHLNLQKTKRIPDYQRRNRTRDTPLLSHKLIHIWAKHETETELKFIKLKLVNRAGFLFGPWTCGAI